MEVFMVSVKLYDNDSFEFSIEQLESMVSLCTKLCSLGDLSNLRQIVFTDNFGKAKYEHCPNAEDESYSVSLANGTTVSYEGEFYIFMDIKAWLDTSELQDKIKEASNKHVLIHELGHVIIDNKFADLFIFMDRQDSDELSIFLAKLFINEYGAEQLAQAYTNLDIPSFTSNFYSMSESYKAVIEGIDDLTSTRVSLDEDTIKRINSISQGIADLSKKVIYNYALYVGYESSSQLLDGKEVHMNNISELDIDFEFKKYLLKLEDIFNRTQGDIKGLALNLIDSVGEVYSDLTQYFKVKVNESLH
jgi:hypothetical protein